jgi:hypothetical protein
VHQVEGFSVLRLAKMVEELVQVGELGPGLIDGLRVAPQPIGVLGGAIRDAAAPLMA